MALEDLTPAVRVEEILNGDDIDPATRIEYFLKKAANEVPKAAATNTGKVLTSTLDAEDNPVITWEEPSSGSQPWDFEVTITQTLDDISGDYVYTSSLSVADYITIESALIGKGEMWGKCLLHYIDEDGITHNSIRTYNSQFGGFPISTVGYSIIVDNIYQVPTVQEYVIDGNGVTLMVYYLVADTSTGELSWQPVES